MANLLNFIREYLDIRRESRSYCKSCEVLRSQLDTVNFEKKQLMDRFVLITPLPPTIQDRQPEAIIPKVVPWKIQRELLEAEDRAKAATMRRQREEMALASVKKDNQSESQPIESNSISIDQLEKELGVQ